MVRPELSEIETTTLFNAVWMAAYDCARSYKHSKRLCKSIADSAGNEALRVLVEDAGEPHQERRLKRLPGKLAKAWTASTGR